MKIVRLFIKTNFAKFILCWKSFVLVVPQSLQSFMFNSFSTPHILIKGAFFNVVSPGGLYQSGLQLANFF